MADEPKKDRAHPFVNTMMVLLAIVVFSAIAFGCVVGGIKLYAWAMSDSTIDAQLQAKNEELQRRLAELTAPKHALPPIPAPGQQAAVVPPQGGTMPPAAAVPPQGGTTVPPSVAASAPPTSGGKCVPVRIKNELIPSGQAMEYPLWFKVSKEDVPLVRDCAKSYGDVVQNGETLPKLEVVQMTKGFVQVEVMNKPQTLFYPHAAGNCVVGDFTPGQTEVVLHKAPCPGQPQQASAH